jgi:16S rRNA (guanine966-N2)-methyltransferase
MRVVGGRLKGRNLASPSSRDIRPTADRLRESLFNILVHAYDDPMEGARVLDLFAGSGALGLEALSRGAASCVFVESSREACRAINANLDKLRLDATVLCQDVARALAAAPAATYDLVLCDPPYDYPSRADLDRRLAALLAPDGLLVYETAARDEPAPPGLTVRTSRKYGSTRLTLFER